MLERPEVWQIDSGGLDDLKAAGIEITDEALEARRSQVSRADVATIVYTSERRAVPRAASSLTTIS